MSICIWRDDARLEYMWAFGGSFRQVGMRERVKDALSYFCHISSSLAFIRSLNAFLNSGSDSALIRSAAGSRWLIQW